MLDHSGRMNHVERLIAKRQSQTVCHHESHSRILAAQKRCIVDSNRRDHAFMRIPILQVVQRIVASIRREDEVQDAVFGQYSRIQHELSDIFAYIEVRSTDTMS